MSRSTFGTSTDFFLSSSLLDLDLTLSDFFLSGSLTSGSSGFLISIPISGTSIGFFSESLPLWLEEDFDFSLADLGLSGKCALGSSGFLISMTSSGISIVLPLSLLLDDFDLLSWDLEECDLEECDLDEWDFDE